MTMTKKVDSTLKYFEGDNTASVNQFLDKLKELQEKLTEDIKVITGKEIHEVKIVDLTDIQREMVAHIEDINRAVNNFMLTKSQLTAFHAKNKHP